jgi:hypothetical protein
MVVVDRPRTRRVNILITEALIEWASTTAEAQGISMSAFVREALERERQRYREEALAKAAELLAPVYSTDPELAAFTSLDGEDFA